ncbi:hypothetical protein LG290_08320 [Halomonas sediminis]
MSYQTSTQRALWALIQRADIIVPVTGRTSYAIDRVTLPLTGKYRIASHRALVLQEGALASAWHDVIAPQLPAARKTLEAAARALGYAFAALDEPVPPTCRVLEDMEVPVYLSIKASGTLSPKAHAACVLVAADYGLTLHANARNAALRPAYTCKAAACRFVLGQLIERQPEDTVIGLGDSLSDLGFMGVSDFAMAPTDSQLWTHVKELSQ